MVANRLQFAKLFRLAVRDWPHWINLNPIEYYDSKRYQVVGLYKLSDEIADKYIGSKDEVIMRNLHDAFYIVLRRAAICCTRLRVKDLRESEVRIHFEQRLKKVTEDADWGKEDFELIELYFRSQVD
ncbi:MAG: hypothetical protein AAGU11_08960 [Syntrophobacteraceae bacterium]